MLVILVVQYEQTCTPVEQQYINDFNDNNNIEQFIQDQVLNIPCGVEIIKQQLNQYQNKQQVNQVNIPDSVIEIQEQAFLNTSLTNVTIPDSVVKMGKQTFSNCKNLIEIYISEQIEEIPELFCFNCTKLQYINLPQNLKHIEQYAFRYDEYLSELQLYDQLISIGQYAFGNTGIQKLIIPDSVIQIGQYAFYGCDSLISIQLSSQMKEIQKNCFGACRKLQEVIIPDGIEQIGNSSFEECKNLQQLNIPQSVKMINESAFKSSIIQQVNIDEGLQYIGKYAFAFQSTLKNIILPHTIQIIEDNVFSTDYNLTCVAVRNQSCDISPMAFSSTLLEDNYQNNVKDNAQCPFPYPYQCNETFIYIIDIEQPDICTNEQNVEYYYIDDQNRKIVLINGCNEQYPNQYPSIPVQCVVQCQNQYIYVQDNICVENCSYEYSYQNYVCNSTCRYYVQDNDNKKYCTENDEQCPEEYEYQIESIPIQCSKQCIDPYIYIQNHSCLIQCLQGYTPEQDTNICLEDKQQKEGLTTGAIIGISISCVVTVALIIVIIFLVLKKNKTNKRIQYKDADEQKQQKMIYI